MLARIIIISVAACALLMLRGACFAWTAEQPVAPGIASVSSPSLAKGPDGRIHLVASIQLAGRPNQKVHYTFWDGSTWAPLDDLPGPDFKEQECRIAVDAGGNLHVVAIYRPAGASSPYTVFYWHRTNAGWSGPEMVSSGQGDDGNSCSSPRVAVDRFGDVHVIWSQNGMVGGRGDILYRRRSGGVWQPIQNLTANPAGTSYGSVSPDLAVDPAGDIAHVVWHDDFLSDGFQAYYTRSTSLGAPGSWWPSAQWFQISTGPYQKAPRIWLDRAGRPFLKWVDRLGGTENRIACRWHTGSVWSPVQNWGGWDVASMEFDERGIGHLAFVDIFHSPNELYYATFDAATGQRSAPQLISAGPDTLKVDSAAMCAYRDGTVFAVWAERKGAWPGVSQLLFSTNYSPGAPADVSSFRAEASDCTNRLYWTNPASPNFSGILICFRTDRPPEFPGDGVVLVDRLSTPGAQDSYVHTGLTNGIPCYYACFTYDAARHYSAGVHTQATPHLLTAGEVRLQPDGAIVDLSGKVVSASFPSSGCFYLQEPDRSSGLRVLTGAAASVSPGDIVSVSGVMGTRVLSGRPSERQLTAQSLAITGRGAPPVPLTMRGIALGGEGVDPYVPGVLGGLGLNNIGLLVRMAGRVTAVSGAVFYVDDGSGGVDPSGNRGVLVLAPVSPAPVAPGALVAVSGIVEGSVPAGQVTNRRLIRLRTADDIALF